LNEELWSRSDLPALLRYLNVIYSPGPVSEPGIEPPLRISERKLRLFACAITRRRLDNFVRRTDVIDLLTKIENAAENPHTDWLSDQFWLASDTTSLWCAEPLRHLRDDLEELVSPSYWVLSPYGHVLSGLLRDIVGTPFQAITERPTGCLDPVVATLAQAAYDERKFFCTVCKGQWGTHDGGLSHCRRCDTHDGHVNNGTLDPARLNILADALAEAGCPQEIPCPVCHGSGWEYLVNTDARRNEERYGWPCRYCRECREFCTRDGYVHHPVLVHLRSPGPHVRGCWALDLILGKE
jgi:hypothetical protein